MGQIYKVFLNEKSIFFSLEEDFFNSNIATILGDMDKSYLIQIEEFAHQKKGDSLVFYTPTPTKSFQHFAQSFKYIEAAGGVVFNEHGHLLVISRLNKWDLPKGKKEKGEQIDKTALREVEEECGITQLSINKELPSTYHMYYHKERWVLKRTYWYEMSAPNQPLIPQLEEAILEAKWIAPSEIKNILPHTYASLQDIFKLYVS